MGEQPEDETKPDEEEDDMSDDDATADDAEADDAENDTDLDNEDPTKGIDSLDSEEGDDEVSTDSESMDDEPSIDGGMSDDDDEVMDMTGASDDEVLKVFKAMKPEDGIVVKKDGNNVEMSTGEDDYIIKLDDEGIGSEMEPDADNAGGPSDYDADNVEDDMDEIVYEIELGEEDEKDEDKKDEEGEVKEIEASEAARTIGAGVRSPAQKTTYKAGRHEMNEEIETLKKQNSEYKKALILFKEKLNEVAVFNANLAYSTRLFTEHSTTKQEKLNILKRFDSISTMNEAKVLFNTIKTELGNKKTVTETVVEKISNTPSTSTSQEVLSEAKAYENPQFKRMKDLMSKIK
jgi:hypothetical protein